MQLSKGKEFDKTHTHQQKRNPYCTKKQDHITSENSGCNNLQTKWGIVGSLVKGDIFC